MNAIKKLNWMPAVVCGFGLLTLVSSTGCQITEAGQTLPSAYYLQDDVQYFAPGPEFKLSREAAAMRSYREEQALQGR